MSESDQLLVPPAAKNDAKSFELLRVWIADKKQHVSLRSGVWKDPAAWGIMFADLSRHVANAFHQDAGLERAEALKRIVAGFNAEIGSPTDDPSGQIVR